MVYHKPTRAFTLIELLVVLAVIGVLLAILAPALAGSKRQADGVMLLSNQRDAYFTQNTYSDDHDSLFPGFGEEGTPVGAFDYKGLPIHLRWWDQMEYWGLYLASLGYEGWTSLGPDAGPGSYDKLSCGSCGQGRSLHVMAAGAFGIPLRFDKDRPQLGSSTHVVQRTTFVRFPASKGVLLHVRSLGSKEGRAPVSYADGHSAYVKSDRLTASGLPASSELPFAPLGVLTTPDGLEGTDP
ncbi:MAG: type II secretion system protein [Planctomycetota bacterium]